MIVQEAAPTGPAVAPAPVAAVGNTIGCEAYRPLVGKHAWDIRIMMAIMEAESTQYGIPCNPNAANRADKHETCMGSFGLFQVSCAHGELYDPSENIEAAWQIYQSQGLRAWGAYTSGAYLKYLK